MKSLVASLVAFPGEIRNCGWKHHSFLRIVTCCHISQLETDASIESLHSLVLDDLLGTVEGVGVLHFHPCSSGLGHYQL